MTTGNKNQSTKSFSDFSRARARQMAGQRNKADFNANHYDIEELAAILKFEYIPLNKGIIQRRIVDLKRKFAKQEKYQKFFNDAEKRLIENLELYNKQSWKDQYEQDNS